MRPAVLVTLAAAAVVPRVARAQLCHDLPPMAVTATEPEADAGAGHAHHHAPAPDPGSHAHDHAGFGVGVGLRLDAATAAIGARPVSYQGAMVHAHAHAGPVVVAAHLPAYRLETPDDTYAGAGDVHVEAWLRVLRRRGLSLGAGLPVGLPTGSASHHLGMGHVMIMPAAFAAVRRGALDAIVVGAYHRAFTGGEHFHGAGPIVAPMAAEEVAAAVHATWWLAPAVGALAEVAAAVPTGTSPTRIAAGVGARWRRGRYDLDVSIQLGLAGDPFIARGVVELHVMP